VRLPGDRGFRGGPRWDGLSRGQRPLAGRNGPLLRGAGRPPPRRGAAGARRGVSSRLMDSERSKLLEAIHATPYQIVLVCAGAGAGGRAMEQLVARRGSSRPVLEAVTPYGRPAFAGFLGREPEHFTTAEVSREMAERAYERALRWAEPRARPLGVACTA